jgi:hypothetical protein
MGIELSGRKERKVEHRTVLAGGRWKIQEGEQAWLDPRIG